MSEQRGKDGLASPNHDWCKRIFDDLDPGPSVEQDDEPEWVWKLLKELSQQAMPSLRIGRLRRCTPRETGLFLGQQCANLFAIPNLMAISSPQNIGTAVEALKGHADAPGVASALKAAESLEQTLGQAQGYFPVFENALQNAFKAALGQPSHVQAAEFFEGFARGIAKPGLGREGLARRTTATLIYLKLYVHRREVEALANYPALHQFLLANGVPEPVLGSERRLQKICERLGLHLGKRGRPRKMRHAR